MDKLSTQQIEELLPKIKSIAECLGDAADTAGNAFFSVDYARADLIGLAYVALRQLLSEREWRPIESWPEGLSNEFTSFLVWCSEPQNTYLVIVRDDTFYHFESGKEVECSITHYMPRPLPPSHNQQGGRVDD